MAAASSARSTPSRAASKAPGNSRSTSRSSSAAENANEATSPHATPAAAKRSRKAPAKTLPEAIKKAKPNALVQRVYNTIDGELTKLEKQKGLTSQDRERASRALSQMVNALEKAVEMQREMTKRKTTGGDAKSKEALAHAEDLRREIAQRLERLNRKRASVRRSE